MTIPRTGRYKICVNVTADQPFWLVAQSHDNLVITEFLQSNGTIVIDLLALDTVQLMNSNVTTTSIVSNATLYIRHMPDVIAL